MATPIYKEFVLKNGGIWPFVVAFVKQHAKQCLERGEPLRLTITSEEKRRTSEANGFYWGVVLRDIAEQAWVEDRQYDKDTWHEHYADLFGVKVERRMPDGRLILLRKSTSDYSVREFSEYLTKVQANAANEHGVSFESVH